MVIRKEKYGLIILLVTLFGFFSTEAFTQDVIGLDAEYCVNSPVDTIYGINPDDGVFEEFYGGGKQQGPPRYPGIRPLPFLIHQQQTLPGRTLTSGMRATILMQPSWITPPMQCLIRFLHFFAILIPAMC
jgi:hypothetical protein